MKMHLAYCNDCLMKKIGKLAFKIKYCMQHLSST